MGSRRRRHRPARLAAMLVGIALAAPACAADEGDPAGLIAYDAFGTSYDIYVVNADGTGERRLTDNDYAEYDPALSPDGTTIVFVIEAFNRGAELYVMGSDGSGRRKLIRENSPWSLKDPVWSPDAREIAFGTATGVHVASPDGTGVRRVTRVEYDADPAWSPDGTKLAFVRNAAIHVVGIDGSGLRRLTPDEMWAEAPAWSPDGQSIVFESLLRTAGTRDYGPDGELWVMNADGGEQRRLSSSPPATSQWRPVWSPDGRRLALVARRFGGHDGIRCAWIQLVDPDGNDPRPVTTRCPGLDADNPSWALPD